MKIFGEHYSTYPLHGNGPTTYTRIRLDKGTGFILDQVAKASPNGGLTRKEFNAILGRGGDGQFSNLWTRLLTDGLIVCANGKWVESTRFGFGNRPRRCLAIASLTKNPPSYVITPAGQNILNRLYSKIRG